MTVPFILSPWVCDLGTLGTFRVVAASQGHVTVHFFFDEQSGETGSERATRGHVISHLMTAGDLLNGHIGDEALSPLRSCGALLNGYIA